MKASLIAILLAALACGGKKSPPRAGDDAGPSTAIDAAAAIRLDSPEALWRAYRAAHAGATKADALRIGRQLDALLSDDARAIIVEAADQMVGALPTTVSIESADVRFRVLGEGAAARAERIGRAVIEVSGKTDSAATITARDGATTLTFPAVREGDQWHLGPAPDLLVKEDELFGLPAGSADTSGAATVEAAAARWVAALNGGTGWDALNALAPSSRARLRAMVAQMGGSGDEDVVRILDKTIRDRRDRGITANPATLEPGTGDRRDVVFTYSNDTRDRFEAVREDGAWWIVVPF